MPSYLHLTFRFRQYVVADSDFYQWLFRHQPDLAECSDQLQDIFYLEFHVRDAVRVSDSAAPGRPAGFPDMNVAIGSIREAPFLVQRDVLLGSEDRAFRTISRLLSRVGVPRVLHSSLERAIRSQASSMANETSNMGRHVIPADVEILIEEEEGGEEEQEPGEEEEREGEDAEEEEEADEGDEIADEVTRYSFDHPSHFAVPATKASIEALEKAKLGDANSADVCMICLEELLIGSESQVSRMPCSHVFHGDCIVQWLQRSHMCPLCRFKMHVD